MIAAPEIQTMALLTLAGLSHRPFLLARESTEMLVEQAVATAAIEKDRDYRGKERQALAAEIGSIVGGHISNALQQIAKALR